MLELIDNFSDNRNDLFAGKLIFSKFT
ncbi:hypothetical protein LCGC14_1561060, partial [marine sediment metagenome]